MGIVRTDYFTYIIDSKKGRDDIVFRAKDQIWNHYQAGVNYSIQVAGPNPQPNFAGQYNAFAKKHLLTVAGGRKANEDHNPRHYKKYDAILGDLHKGIDLTSLDQHQQDTFRDLTTSKLSKIHDQRQNGEFHKLLGKRAQKSNKLNEDNRAQFQVQTLGGATQTEDVPLTMVLCDMLTPDALKGAFAHSIHEEIKRRIAQGDIVQDNTLMRGPQNHGVEVRFNNDCVFQHDSKLNEFTRGDKIRVTIYIETKSSKNVKAHVVHCHGI